MKITIDIKEMLRSSEEDVLEAIAERLKWGDNAIAREMGKKHSSDTIMIANCLGHRVITISSEKCILNYSADKFNIAVDTAQGDADIAYEHQD